MRILLLVSLLATAFPSFADAANPAPVEHAALAGEPAWASPADRERKLRLQDADATSLRLAPLAAERLKRLQEANAAPGRKALRLGIEREPRSADGKSAEPTLRWQPVRDGGLVRHWSITSPGAAALRVGLDIAELPTGAELRFAAAGATESVVAVVDAAEVARLRQSHPVYWTPVTEGDTQLVELYLPPRANPDPVRMSLASVSHLVASPQGVLDTAKIGESDYCEIDVGCLESPSQSYLNAKTAVARLVYQAEGFSYLCTGTLLNDSDSATQIPYMYSAAHCFDSQSVASTLTTFWFYESSACDSGVLSGGARQLSGGATLLYASAASDVLFFKLNQAPPAGAWFLGWNSAAIASGTEFLAIHHPAGDVKKVAFGKVARLGSSSLASGSFIKVAYSDGTTEGGSSGCALLTRADSGYQLRGGLLGGAASCATSGTSSPENSDDFSRFDLAYPSLRQYLRPETAIAADFSGVWYNPDESGWGLNVFRGGSGAYVVILYHYAQDATPVWYLSTARLAGNRYTAPALAFTGPWFGFTPFRPDSVSSRTAGTITIDFSSATSGAASITIDGRTASAPLTRLAY